MEENTIIRQQLLKALKGRNAHLSFEDTVKDFPVDYYNKKIDGVLYSCWDLLEHIRIAQSDILDFIMNPDYKEKPWPEGYWPVEEADQKNWNKSIENFLRDRRELENMVTNISTDLLSPILHAPEYTIFREILLVIDHSSYHIGQLLTLRKGLGIWPEE